jgi:MoxR-like ATPase
VSLALRMGRPNFLEGGAAVGKTEIAKVLSASAILGRRLIRLQCYEGLGVTGGVNEWNYAAQNLTCSGIMEDNQLVSRFFVTAIMPRFVSATQVARRQR